MGVNKVVYNGGTLIDISEDTVESGKMLKDTTAHDKTGEPVIGSIHIVSGGSFEPSTSERTVVSGGSYVQNDVKIGAIPSEYKIPSGTKTITENGTHDVANYASVNIQVAGSGDSIETCTVTVVQASKPMLPGNCVLMYVDKNGTLVSIDVIMVTEAIEIPCPSIISTNYSSLKVSGSGEFVKALDLSELYGVYVTGDCTITW